MSKHTLWCFLLLLLTDQMAAQNWQPLIELGGLNPYPFCNSVQNGIAQIPPAAVNSDDYRTRLVLNDTFYVGNQFAIEARILNAEANGGINAFDPGMYIEGCSIDFGASLMGDMRALSFTSIYAGTRGRTDIVNFVQDFSFWRVLRYEIRNNNFSVRLDGVLLFTLPYTGEINFIEQIMVRFKGSGLLDWVKLYDRNNQQIWMEDFTDCNNSTPAPSLAFSLDFQLSNDTSVCRGEPVQLRAQALAGATFSWSGPSGFTSNQASVLLNSVNPKDTGYYKVAVNYKNCITISDSIYVGLNNLSFPSVGFLGNDTTLCLGDSLVLGQTYPCARYRWQNGSTNATQIVNKAGLYIATIEIDNQTFTDSIQIEYYNLPEINLGNDTILCNGVILTLNATLATAATYRWQDGATTATYNVQTAGLYHVMLTDVCGRTTTDSIYIDYYKILKPLQLGNDTTLCSGQTLILSVQDSAAIRYQWQDGSNNANFLVNNAGIYAVTLTDNCNNNLTDSIDIQYFELVKPFSLGKDTILCPGETLLLQVTDPAAIRYQWQDGSTTSNFNVQRAGNYTVTITDACGNQFSDSIQVQYHKVLNNLELGRDTMLCPGQTLLLNAFDSAAVIYRWQDGSRNPTYLVNRAGSYIVYMADNCGNTSTDIIRVGYFDVITAVNIGRDTTLCPGETLLLNATDPAAKFYRWQNGSTQPTLTASQPGVYTVQVTDNCGNTLSDAIEIKYFPVLTKLDLGRDTSLCPGTSIQLNAADPAAIRYRWQDGSTQSDFKVTSPGIYSVIIEDNCNNVLNDSVQIAYYQLVKDVNIGPRDTSLCVGENLLLNATTTDAKNYLWQDGANTPTYNVTQPGIYQVVVNDFCGNSASDEIRIRFYDIPKPVNIITDTVVCEGEVFRLNATAPNATFYQWQDGLNEPIYPVTKPGLYLVTVGNDCGENTYSIDIAMQYCGPCRSYIPTAFSPNSDGNNDTFVI
ncbi:MAG: hypothetical protein ACK4TA_03785, partial [Saprospiraceae bacterium]